MRPLLVALFTTVLLAEAPGVIESRKVDRDFSLTLDPAAAPWRNATPVSATADATGKSIRGHETEIRAVWTDKNLYLLYSCPYEKLFLKPSPLTAKETNKLWDYDVAELFIGTDLQHIQQYKEFEVSPQGEWVDLDIDRTHPKPEGGWLWNSGFEAKARIDTARKVWYAAMRIPFAALDVPKPQVGREFRVNLYRIEGGPPDRMLIAWQPTHARSFHVPEAFGRMRLVSK